MELLDAFASNSSLAGALGAAHALTGTWRSTVSDMRQVEQLTPADVQEVWCCVHHGGRHRDLNARACSKLHESDSAPTMTFACHAQP